VTLVWYITHVTCDFLTHNFHYLNPFQLKHMRKIQMKYAHFLHVSLVTHLTVHVLHL